MGGLVSKEQLLEDGGQECLGCVESWRTQARHQRISVRGPRRQLRLFQDPAALFIVPHHQFSALTRRWGADLPAHHAASSNHTRTVIMTSVTRLLRIAGTWSTSRWPASG